MLLDKITELLGDEADSLLAHNCQTIPREMITAPGPDFTDRVHVQSSRNNQVLNSLARLYGHGRLGGTGYLSILPVDQGVEHTAGASFAANPAYFDPENIVKLALESGCSAVASSFGVLASVARRYAHKIPFLVKINHNELMTYPNKYDQIMFGTVRDAWNMGAVAVGATIYFGSAGSDRQLTEVARAFAEAHELGMATVLWCYTRNEAFKRGGVDYHTATDLTSQAVHLGVTIQADIVKQKMPDSSRPGFRDLDFGKWDPRMYEQLMSDHPIDQCRYQVLNCYAGRAPLINSGGASKGDSDLREAVYTAVVNKRAGGAGLIMGRKSFQRPLKAGVEILHAVQDVYLENGISLA